MSNEYGKEQVAASTYNKASGQSFDKPRPSYSMARQVEEAFHSYIQVCAALGYAEEKPELSRNIVPVREAARAAAFREALIRIYAAFGFAPPETL